MLRLSEKWNGWSKPPTETVRGDRLEALSTVALSLGLRQGEALGLRRQNIDFEAGTLRAAAALHEINGQPARLVEPKTRQSRRTLPIPAALATQVARPPHAPTGGVIGGWSLATPLADRCATLLVAQGTHPREVMEILGHSTITLTMNTCARAMPQAQRTAPDALSSALFTCTTAG
jgi:integrase